jgi:hypothetical protein
MPISLYIWPPAVHIGQCGYSPGTDVPPLIPWKLLRQLVDFPGAILCDENVSLHQNDAAIFGGVSTASYAATSDAGGVSFWRFGRIHGTSKGACVAEWQMQTLSKIEWCCVVGNRSFLLHQWSEPRGQNIQEWRTMTENEGVSAFKTNAWRIMALLRRRLRGCACHWCPDLSEVFCLMRPCFPIRIQRCSIDVPSV